MLPTNKISDVAAGEVIRKRPEKPMESEEEPASKRIKLSTNNVNNSRACAVRNVEHNTTGNWNILPYVVLEMIYSLLPNKDRFNMSLTCRAWGDPMTTSSIWTSLKFKLNRTDDGRTEEFVKKVKPKFLKHLSIDCAEAKDAVIRERDSLAYLQALLRYFVEQKTDKLVSLRLANLSRIVVRLAKFSKHKDLMFTLRRFLEIQTQLNVLKLSRAGFTLKQGSSMLTKVGRSCGSKIETLIIDGLFSLEENKDHAAVVLLEPFRLFTSLTWLTLSFEYISTGLIVSLATYKTLKVVRIVVSNINDEGPLTAADWDIMIKAHPNLSTEFLCMNGVNYYILKSIMSSALQLKKFKWTVDESFTEQGWSEDAIGATVRLISEVFSNSIEEVSVQLQTCSPILVNIFNPILNCQKMKKLSIFVPMAKFTEFSSKLRFKVNANSYKTQLKTFWVNDKEIPIDSRDALVYKRTIQYDVSYPRRWWGLP